MTDATKSEKSIDEMDQEEIQQMSEEEIDKMIEDSDQTQTVDDNQPAVTDTKKESDSGNEEKPNDLLTDLVGGITDQAKESDQESENTTEAQTVKEVLQETADRDPAIGGLIKDLQGERTKRQTLEKTVEKLKEKLEKSTAKDQTFNEDENPTTIAGIRKKYDLQQDDAFTLAQQEELENNRSLKQKQEQQRNESNVKSEVLERIEKSEDIARSKYTAITVGDGLDYDTVKICGQSFLTQADKRAILASENVAEEIYKRCLKANPVTLALAKTYIKAIKPSDTVASGTTKTPANQPIPRGSKQKDNEVQIVLKEQEYLESLHEKSDEELDQMLATHTKEVKT